MLVHGRESMAKSAYGSRRGVALAVRMLHPLAECSRLYLFQVYALVITIAAAPLVALYVTAAAYQTVSVKLARIDRRQHGPL